MKTKHFCYEENIDYSPGNHFKVHLDIAHAEDCQLLCQQDPNCKYWTYGEASWQQPRRCWLKTVKGIVVPGVVGVTSGPKNCPSLSGPSKYILQID